MRSASANTASMSCSTSTMVTSLRNSFSSATMRVDSVAPRPAIGSSSGSNFGFVASATASSSSRCSPWLSSETGTSARASSPTRFNADFAASRRCFSLRALPQKRNEWPSCACAASATLSIAEKSGSSEVIWNDRASPSRLRRYAGSLVTSRPAKRMVPEFGDNCPVSWLISVVLPAPLGPMIACNSPLMTSSDRLSVAVMPPNRRTSFSTRSRGSTTAPPPEQAHDAAAREQHDQQQQRPHDQRPIFGELRQQLFQHQIKNRADHRPEQRAHAAEDHHHHEIAGAGPVHHRRADEVGIVGEQRAGEAADHARDDEADESVTIGVKANRLHALLVGAHPLHHHAEARIDDAPDQIEAAEQATEAEIVKLHPVREIDQSAEIAALVDGEAVVAAVARKAGGNVIGHLRKGQRD